MKGKQKELNDKIEEFAKREKCPSHIPQMRACTYADGVACFCRMWIEAAEEGKAITE